MSDAVIASGLIAVAVMGFAPQNNAMLAAGTERAFKTILDGIVANICGWLLLFALSLCVLHLLPPWASRATMILSSLFLALAGLARYISDPEPARPTSRSSDTYTITVQHVRNPENWAVAAFLAGSALIGSVTLAAAFTGLVLLTTFGSSAWAMAGWLGCQHLASGWHRRHLDWAFGILMFVAAITSLVP